MHRCIGAQPVASKGSTELAIAAIRIRPCRGTDLEILQGIAPGSCQFDLFRRAIKQYKIGPYRPLRRHQSVTTQLTAQAARKVVAARGHQIGRLKLEDLPIVLASTANRSQIRPGQERLRGHTRQAAACQLHHKRRAVIQNPGVAAAKGARVTPKSRHTRRLGRELILSYVCLSCARHDGCRIAASVF